MHASGLPSEENTENELDSSEPTASSTLKFSGFLLKSLEDEDCPGSNFRFNGSGCQKFKKKNTS